MQDNTAAAQQATMPLRTPEQVADDLGRDEAGNHLVSPFMIRRLVRDKKVACTRLGRGRVVFTAGQVAAMVEQLAEPAGQPVPRRELVTGDNPVSVFTPSARSAKQRR